MPDITISFSEEEFKHLEQVAKGAKEKDIESWLRRIVLSGNPCCLATAERFVVLTTRTHKGFIDALTQITQGTQEDSLKP